MATLHLGISAELSTIYWLGCWWRSSKTVVSGAMQDANRLDANPVCTPKEAHMVPDMGAKRLGRIGNAERVIQIGTHSRSRPRDCMRRAPVRRH